MNDPHGMDKYFKCQCEHWQDCRICRPDKFDADGGRIPVAKTDLEHCQDECSALRANLAQISNLPNALRLAACLEETMQWPVHNKAADELRRLHAELEAVKQAITDPENQPSQFCTVTVEYMQREIEAEREACAKVCDDIDAEYGGEDVLATWCAAAIRARDSA